MVEYEKNEKPVTKSSAHTKALKIGGDSLIVFVMNTNVVEEMAFDEVDVAGE